MSFTISTYNYLARPEMFSIQGVRRANVARYNFCPSIADDTVQTLRFKNVSGATLKVGYLVLGNVLNTDVTISSMIADGVSIITSNKVFLDSSDTNYSSIYDKHLTSGHYKIVPIIIDAEGYNLTNNSELIITFTQPIRCGWIWLGDSYKLVRGMAKPTKSELKSNTKYVELENGDKLIESGSLKKSITCAFSYMDELDKSFLSNHLQKGEMYLVSAFKPFQDKICNIYDMTYTTEFDERVLGWKGFTGLTRLMTGVSFTFDQYTMYSSTLTFAEVL